MPRRTRRTFGLLVALGLLSTIFLAGSARGAATCAVADHAGGDWNRYGQDLANTRSQPDEKVIGAAEAATLQAVWAFSPADQGGIGRLESTPVIAEGCMYISTSAGWMFAVNADTGELVWKNRIAVPVSGVCCGGTLFAPTVEDGVLYINVSSNPATNPDQKGPHVVALDAHTGVEIWRSLDVADERGAYTNSSPTVFDGMVWIGISNPESGFHEIGGFAIVDARNGAILKRTKTVPADQAAKGFAGGAIWSTAAVDEDGYGYAGTGQPSDWSGKESERVNAIVKFDFARARDASGKRVDLDPDATPTNPNFGEIIDSLKGTWDDPPYIDVDFAGSPTLYRDANGEQMVAEFQKSGWLHAGHTRHMSHAWSRPLSPLGIPLGNYASTASDGTNIFAAGTYPGLVASFNGTTGVPNWAVPVPTVFGANPLAYANGIVWHADGKGILNAIDAETGAFLLQRPMQADTGGMCTNIGGGVAIARNTVYSVCGDRNYSAAIGPSSGPSGWVVAYRVPNL